MRFVIFFVRFFGVKLYSMCFLAMSITVVCFFMAGPSKSTMEPWLKKRLTAIQWW